MPISSISKLGIKPCSVAHRRNFPDLIQRFGVLLIHLGGREFLSNVYKTDRSKMIGVVEYDDIGSRLPQRKRNPLPHQLHNDTRLTPPTPPFSSLIGRSILAAVLSFRLAVPTFSGIPNKDNKGDVAQHPNTKDLLPREYPKRLKPLSSRKSGILDSKTREASAIIGWQAGLRARANAGDAIGLRGNTTLGSLIICAGTGSTIVFIKVM